MTLTMIIIFLMVWVMNRNGFGDEVEWIPKEVPPEILPSLRMYTLSLSYMDQISWASKRLRSLQCWASMWKALFYDVHVVEPFVMNGAHLGLPSTDNQAMGRTLKFSDIFDIETWNSVGKLRGIDYPKVVSWDNFLKYAPRNVVTIQFVYAYDYRCVETHLSETSCGCLHLNQTMSKVLKPHNFTLVKQLCIDFNLLGLISMQEFNDYIYDAIPKQTPVTIIFDEWRGPVDQHLTNHCFILVDSRACTPNTYGHGVVFRAPNDLLTPSLKIKNHTTEYISQYLDDKSGYVAVMIRWEKVVLADFYDPKSTHFTGSECVEKIAQYLTNIYEQTGMSTAFVAVDVGKYGSTSQNLYKDVEQNRVHFISYTETLLRTISNDDSISLADHDRKLEEVSGSTDRAFISQLQKSIAANARCLLLVGSGMFHENALKMYQKLHPGKRDCHAVIRAC